MYSPRCDARACTRGRPKIPTELLNRFRWNPNEMLRVAAGAAKIDWQAFSFISYTALTDRTFLRRICVYQEYHSLRQLTIFRQLTHADFSRCTARRVDFLLLFVRRIFNSEMFWSTPDGLSTRFPCSNLNRLSACSAWKRSCLKRVSCCINAIRKCILSVTFNLRRFLIRSLSQNPGLVYPRLVFSTEKRKSSWYRCIFVGKSVHAVCILHVLLISVMLYLSSYRSSSLSVSRVQNWKSISGIFHRIYHLLLYILCVCVCVYQKRWRERYRRCTRPSCSGRRTTVMM